MKIRLWLLTIPFLLACGQALALPADHPANPEAAVPAFQPADYFAGTATLAEAEHEHQHEVAPAAEAAGTKEEAAQPEHKKDKGMGMECMKMHGGGKKESGMHDCPMMEKMMPQEGGKAASETKKDEGHESHH